jgi:hypothetical protein
MDGATGRRTPVRTTVDAPLPEDLNPRMTSLLLGGFLLLFLAAMVAGLWVGVLGHRKAGRDGAWWTMLVGLILISIGILVPTVAGWFVFESFSNSRAGGGSPALGAPLLGILGLLSYTFLPLGLILFSIGFALNGLKAGRIHARVKELEQISDAMGEEISRLSSTPPRA